ncbi:hypothetical protein AT15_08480 [Kosmotoga arenicorallina S304]|uniref:ECF transporter S component n=1 Tax=Kosmotoga arenicorallina S304 TaxID=1453497 RepID=A0A176K1H5_9BACT|nr:ECF transporter S component [Kosmotoga arenicorallina]OAA31002.1 hypothetical protein AT15_08480 [Kosmotoga arenicorallina S304]
MNRRITALGMWLALGFTVSLFFHQFPIKVGQVLLPLHFVVILAGAISGPFVGSISGLLTPLLSALIVGKPPIQPPIAIFMAFELLTYGLITGFLVKRWKSIYLSMLLAWIAGRLVYTLEIIVVAPMLGFQLGTISALSISYLLGLPGVAIQLFLIPVIYRRLGSFKKA